MKNLAQHKMLTALSVMLSEAVKMVSFTMQFDLASRKAFYDKYLEDMNADTDKDKKSAMNIDQFFESIEIIACQTAFPTSYDFVVHHKVSPDSSDYGKVIVNVKKSDIIKDLRDIARDMPEHYDSVERLVEEFKTSQGGIDKAKTSQKLQEALG